MSCFASCPYRTRLCVAVSGNEGTHCRGQIVVFPSTLVEIQSFGFITCSLLTVKGWRKQHAIRAWEILASHGLGVFYWNNKGVVGLWLRLLYCLPLEKFGIMTLSGALWSTLSMSHDLISIWEHMYMTTHNDLIHTVYVVYRNTNTIVSNNHVHVPMEQASINLF